MHYSPARYPQPNNLPSQHPNAPQQGQQMQHAGQAPFHGKQPSNVANNRSEQQWADVMRLKVFGGKAALEFFEAETRGGKTGKGWKTIQIDAAYKIQGKEVYDWQRKSIIQITRLELPYVIAVLLGVRSSCAYKAHGPNKDKGFEMERQPNNGSVFFKVFDGQNGTKAVPIPMVEAMMIGHMALAQYLENFDGRISSDVVMNSLHSLA
ncbi:hypothetical protein [Aliidiomarina quisquiliarum]|uniref:hypothetical protein n=1 Tax=Aliidiomarina quisquiliarum TaxID=2938947 RepID=UPI00208F12DE|nr:hypothetical protein [Aliidiomarina quisquiliarum]MCO4319887.1 hypothetical protein [Aliidiomarina quisquiliarum]